MIVSRGLAERIVRGMAIELTRIRCPVKSIGVSFTFAIHARHRAPLAPRPTSQALLFEAAIRDHQTFRGFFHENRIGGSIRDLESSEFHGLLRAHPDLSRRGLHHAGEDAFLAEKFAPMVRAASLSGRNKSGTERH